MSDTVASLDRKIKVAGDLHKVVRSMKAVAASKIAEYEKSLNSVNDYYNTVEIGLAQCLHNFRLNDSDLRNFHSEKKIVVFGSDQGLVGQFNNIVCQHTLKALSSFTGKYRVWTVGERLNPYLIDAGINVTKVFALSETVKSIASLVSEILIETSLDNSKVESEELYLIYNQRTDGSRYAPNTQRLLPLDKEWQEKLLLLKWPSNKLPQILESPESALKSFVREYLFVSIFKACIQSLSSENASRLSAMQRADKNIEDLLDELQMNYHKLRQTNINEELFDVISGYESLNTKHKF